MGLTKTDAVTYASQGIRINAICPGYVGTPLLKQAEVSLNITRSLAISKLGSIIGHGSHGW
jgi:NAD(P)-dependent dehydrogenase (short-subunit alcohol dehydrogenase family)